MPKVDLTPESNNYSREGNYDVNEIANVNELLPQVITFVEYIQTPEMIALEKDNEVVYERHLEEKFPEFTEKYFSTFKLLLDRKNLESNLSRLVEMFEVLGKVKEGKIDFRNADMSFKERMNETYVYPKFGGKDKFMKKMASSAKK
jgi:hypothetical protein